MTDKISRRDFLKLAGAGAATTAVLTGCGPAAKYVTRQPYFKMPEYTYNGESTYFATTCRECSAGCGLVVRTMQGRALKVEGNPNHPVNLGKTCARGQVTLQGLYNPDRVTNPVKQGRASKLSDASLSWDDAIATVTDALQNHKPSEIAFFMGLASDHLFDLVTELTQAIEAPAPVRFGALGMFESRATLSKAVEELYGQPALPFFDIANADVVLSFGANFLETWLSPVAFTRDYSKMRKGKNGRRGYLIQFEARMSQTGSVADEWMPVRPGTEGLVALALGRLVAEAAGSSLPAYLSDVDVADVAKKSGVTLDSLKAIAARVSQAFAPLALVGGAALGQSNGLQIAKSVLVFNAIINKPDSPTMHLSPLAPGQDAYHRPANGQEMADFVKKMKSGAVKVLFIHGVNPVFELPKSLGFADALKSVETVISFATFPDETALMADYIFPDHHGLESFGYQRAVTGVAPAGLVGLQSGSGDAVAPALSSLQPAVTPFQDTRATADVLLAAVSAVGGTLAEALNFPDVFAYIQNKLQEFVTVNNGSFTAPETNSFMAYFQQHGGWWKPEKLTAVPSLINTSLKSSDAKFGDGEYFLVPFVSPVLGDAGANKPWLQEVPDPTTTIMWNSWVEMHPDTAKELGVENDDVVKLISAAGEVEASVYLYPAIRPDTIAVPFGQGHTAYGQYAARRGFNPVDLLSPSFNEAGDLAFGSVKVRVEKTGRKQVLSRLESKMGVYGQGLENVH